MDGISGCHELVMSRRPLVNHNKKIFSINDYLQKYNTQNEYIFFSFQNVYYFFKTFLKVYCSGMWKPLKVLLFLLCAIG